MSSPGLLQSMKHSFQVIGQHALPQRHVDQRLRIHFHGRRPVLPVLPMVMMVHQARSTGGRPRHVHPARHHEQARAAPHLPQQQARQRAHHGGAHGRVPQLLHAAVLRALPAAQLHGRVVARARAAGGCAPAHLQAGPRHARLLQQGSLISLQP
ncbi:hypothetical protein ON010_g6189 [Phytophthora cinnamomi]|nr:hypothetical protein ON010_g6189 [Phytophthora cinnamomi]